MLTSLCSLVGVDTRVELGRKTQEEQCRYLYMISSSDDRHKAQSRDNASALSQDPISVLTSPDLSLVIFRLVLPGPYLTIVQSPIVSL